MCGMGSMVTKDVPRYVMVPGDPAKAHGMNVEGMRRRGMPADGIKALRSAYKMVYIKGMPLEQALSEIESSDIVKVQEVADFVRSIRQSNRGIVR